MRRACAQLLVCAGGAWVAWSLLVFGAVVYAAVLRPALAAARAVPGTCQAQRFTPAADPTTTVLVAVAPEWAERALPVPCFHDPVLRVVTAERPEPLLGPASALLLLLLFVLSVLAGALPVCVGLRHTSRQRRPAVRHRSLQPPRSPGPPPLRLLASYRREASLLRLPVHARLAAVASTVDTGDAVVAPELGRSVAPIAAL
eukprot:TRINITY_DN6484_c0_g1_i1.p1 TRINITY_DN6484_c0_g1~~TRINITY_DN6484_c0_g1_i1.p1  ORF type:complete len:201 (-),score=51.86 TRINITY_DN6484_c0_g1_i1:87-689(-)